VLEWFSDQACGLIARPVIFPIIFAIFSVSMMVMVAFAIIIIAAIVMICVVVWVRCGLGAHFGNVANVLGTLLLEDRVFCRAISIAHVKP
jgi:hypothetical protein